MAGYDTTQHHAFPTLDGVLNTFTEARPSASVCDSQSTRSILKP